MVSKKVAFETDISPVNLIVGWRLFACSMKCLTTNLLVCMREIMLSMKASKRAPLSRTCISILAMKIFAKATAVLVPMPLP